MQSRLVTQVSSDKPVVLVIGTDSWVQTEICKQFRQFDFEVVIVSYLQITSTLLVSKQWYKIIITVGFESQFYVDALQTIDQLSLLTSRLNSLQTTLSIKPHYKNSVVCISPNWSFYTDQDDPSSKINKALRSFQRSVIQRFSTIHLILVHNPLLPQQVTISDTRKVPVLDFVLQSRRSNKIIYFNSKISLLGEDSFKKQLRELLRQPYFGEKRYSILLGSVFSARQIAQELIRRVYVQFGIKLQEQLAIFSDSRMTHSALNEITDFESKSKTTKIQESLPQLLAPVFEMLFPTGQAFLATPPSVSTKLPPLSKNSILHKNSTLNTNSAVATTSNLPKNHQIQRQSSLQITPQSKSGLIDRPQQVVRSPQIVRPQQNTVVSVKKTSQHLDQKRSIQQTEQLKTKPSNQKIDEKLQALFSQERIVQKTDHISDLKVETQFATSKNRKRKTAFYGGTFISIGAFLLLFFAGIFIFSTKQLKNELVAVLISQSNTLVSPTRTVKNSDISLTDKRSNQEIPNSLRFKTMIVSSQLAFYSRFIPPSFFYEPSNLIDISTNFDSTLIDLEVLKEKQIDLVLNILGKNTALVDPSTLQSDGANGTRSVYDRLSRLSAQLQEFIETEQFGGKKSEIQKVASSIEKQRAALLMYQQLEPLLPGILGNEGKKTYAVIFQNEQELRATGGFIQAVALLTFDSGMLIDFQVFSSYQLDNQLAALVEPPTDLKEILGENRLFLRDANWNPDFPSSANQISWFLDQILGKKVDGVIGINIHVLQDLLAGVGPLELKNYNEVITEKNIFERMEFHSEITLVETSESNDYAVVLLKALFQKISEVPQESIPALLSSLSTSIEEKQLLIQAKNPQVTEVISGLGWSGSLLSPACPAQLSVAPCLVDTLAVIDSNVGVNKANAHLKRTDRHTVLLDDRAANHSHSITFENTAQSNAWPKGPYQSYLRFYIPVSSTVKSMIINGQKIDDSELMQEPFSVVDIEKNPTLSKFKNIGVRTSTPIKTKTQIDFEYSTPLLSSQVVSSVETPLYKTNQKSGTNSTMSYVFYMQKQPGSVTPLSAITLSYPPSLIPMVIAPQAQTDLDSITYTNLDKEHIFVGALFDKK